MLNYIEKDHISPAEGTRMFDEYSREAVLEEKYAQGRQEGEHKKAEETARNLLTLGTLTLEQIAQATGLSVERIKELAAHETLQ